jgi:hypothetical protein
VKQTTDIDRDLTRLEQASERIAANLVELEIDSSRQLLEASTLTGDSAARWAQASAALTDLWAWRDRLEGLLQQAEKLRRSASRADELQELLAGRSIELTRSTIPLAERDLLTGPELAVRCTPDELLERMSLAFDQVKTVVARFAEAWEALIPRLGEARTILERARGLAVSRGEPDQSELRNAAARLAELSYSVTADPLAIAPEELEHMIDSLAVVEHDLQAAATLRRALDAELGDARARLARLDALVQECRDAHHELLVKISTPSAPAPPDIPTELPSELDEVGACARAGAWRAARQRLDAWTERTNTLLDDTHRTLRANRAPIEARNQLRALLEAYQVKAARLGVIEDPRAERRFTEAHEALYTAPTDLALASQLVRGYQELLSAPRPAKEVLQ